MNINDVAREAGVSKTTVSRVLLGSDKVKPKTRETVLEVMKRMNYVPNTSAQMLAKKSNKVIGIINGFPISDPFFAYMNDLLGRECRKHDYEAIYTVSHDAKKGCEKEIAVLYGKVDAFVIMGNENIISENIEKIVNMNMPVALFKTGISNVGAMTVDVDNMKSGEEAARFLYEKGYRKFGYFKADSFAEGTLRHQGFMRAVKELGIPLVCEFTGDRTYRNAYESAEYIYGTGIDALFCDTDIMAYGVTAALNAKKIEIPEKMAVLGFDGIKFENFENPTRLSTVAQPMEQMAKEIIRALVDKIENDIPYETIKLFDTKIVEEMTT